METPKEIGMYVLELSTKISKLKKDKKELLEMLEMIADGTAFCNTSGRIWQHWLESIESLIQKHNQ